MCGSFRKLQQNKFPRGLSKGLQCLLFFPVGTPTLLPIPQPV